MPNTACECRVENRGPRNPNEFAGTTVIDLWVVHCPRHTEAHVAELEAEVERLQEALRIAHLPRKTGLGQFQLGVKHHCTSECFG
mgnify:FL=1